MCTFRCQRMLSQKLFYYLESTIIEGSDAFKDRRILWPNVTKKLAVTSKFCIIVKYRISVQIIC